MTKGPELLNAMKLMSSESAIGVMPNLELDLAYGFPIRELWLGGDGLYYERLLRPRDPRKTALVPTGKWVGDAAKSSVTGTPDRHTQQP